MRGPLRALVLCSQTHVSPLPGRWHHALTAGIKQALFAGCCLPTSAVTEPSLTHCTLLSSSLIPDDKPHGDTSGFLGDEPAATLLML